MPLCGVAAGFGVALTPGFGLAAICVIEEPSLTIESILSEPFSSNEMLRVSSSGVNATSTVAFIRRSDGTSVTSMT